MQGKTATNEKPTRRKARLLVGLVVLCAVAFTAVIVTFVCYRLVHTGTPEDSFLYYEYASDLPSASYVLVPGSAVVNGRISPLTQNRLKRAAALYSDGLTSFIVVSAGSGETEPMTSFLLEAGIPAEAIRIDNYGLDTYQSLSRAKAAYPDRSLYFCTQEYYGQRAAYLMKALGMDGHCINTDLIISKPDIAGRAREYLAATKAVWEAGLLHPTAKYDIITYPFVTVEGGG
jgi:vancomycin permeability regulator SanA